MKIVALEEHFVPDPVFDAWAKLPSWQRDISYEQSATGDTRRRLLDIDGERLRQMDLAGVDTEVLSLTAPGTQVLDSDSALALCVSTNDLLAATVQARPDRYQGFATLPLASPDHAAAELRRAVCDQGLSGAMFYGRLNGKNADDRIFWPVYEEAARLRAPLYLHPQSPAPPIRELYYGGLPGGIDDAFASGGIGWHYETGVQALRMIMAGVFDVYPDLQLILGHWGEVVMFYLDRIELLNDVAGAPARPISTYWRSNIFVTASGIFSARYLQWAVDIVGTDRIMFSTDYPYQIGADGQARRFVEESPLDAADQEKLACANWDKLMTQVRRT